MANEANQAAPTATPSPQTTPAGTQTNAANTAANVPKPSPEELFARREKALRRESQRLAQEKQQWEAERKKYETEYVPKSKLKESWYDVLAEQGMSHEEMAQQLINAPNDPTTRAIMAKMRAMEQKLQETQQQAANSAIEQEAQIKKQMGADIKASIAASTDYEALKSVAGAEEMVLDYVTSEFERTGILMDIEDACAKFEELLIEDAMKAAQWKKVQEKLKPVTQESTKTPAATAPQTNNADKPKWTSTKSNLTVTPKTLSNTMQTTVSTKTSERQRIERAIAAFQGKPIT